MLFGKVVRGSAGEPALAPVAQQIARRTEQTALPAREVHISQSGGTGPRWIVLGIEESLFPKRLNQFGRRGSQKALEIVN
jgi:hypothetical protein